jgi:hypothetical protein
MHGGPLQEIYNIGELHGSVTRLYSIRFYIGLCWYQKGTNSKWGYNHIDHLMVDLEITVAVLAFMIHIAYLDAYKVHLGDEKVFNNFIDKY